MLGSIVLFFFLISEEGSESRETLTDGNVFLVVTLEHAGCGSHPGAIRATMQKLFKSRPLTTTTACVVLGGAINSCQGRGSSFSLSPRVVPSLPSRPELAPLILFSVCPVSAAAATRSLPSPSPDPPFLGATNGLSRPIARRQHEPAREPQPRQTSGEGGKEEGEEEEEREGGGARVGCGRERPRPGLRSGWGLAGRPASGQGGEARASLSGRLWQRAHMLPAGGRREVD